MCPYLGFRLDSRRRQVLQGSGRQGMGSESILCKQGQLWAKEGCWASQK